MVHDFVQFSCLQFFSQEFAYFAPFVDIVCADGASDSMIFACPRMASPPRCSNFRFPARVQRARIAACFSVRPVFGLAFLERCTTP